MKNSIYRKIFISFFLLVVIYTVIIAGTVIRNTYQQEESNLKNNVTYTLEKRIHDINDQFLAANNAIKLLSDSKSVKDLATTDIEGYISYSPIYDDMIKNPYFLNYFSQYNIALTKGFGSECISTNGYFDFFDYFDFMHLGKQLDELKAVFSDFDKNEIAVIQSEKSVMLVRYLKIQNAKSPLIFFATWNKNTLLEREDEKFEGTFSLIDTTLTKTSSQQDVKDHLRTFNPTNIEDDHIHQYEHNGLAHFISKSTAIPTVVFDLSMDMQQQVQFPSKMILSLLGYLVVLLGIGMALIFILSKKNYQPYQQIIEEVHTADGADEETIDSLVDKIHNLVEKNKDLKQFKSDASDDIKELFIKNLLFGNYSTNEMNHFMEVVDLHAFNKGGFLTIIDIKSSTNEIEKYSISERASRHRQFIEDQVKQDGTSLLVELSTNRFVILSPADHKPSIQAALLQIISGFKEHFEIDADYYMSVPFDNLIKIPEVFSDVYPYVNGSKKMDLILSSDDFENEFNFKIDLEQRLISLINTLRFEEAMNIIEDVLRNSLKPNKTNLQTLQSTKFLLFNTIKRVLQSNSLDDHSFYKANIDVINTLQNQNDPQEAANEIIALYHQLFAKVKAYKASEKNLEEKMVDYIDQNYQRDLSLGEVADQFHLSESYASRIIKDHLGISFKIYLNQIRVDKAKLLLTTTDLKVAEIAEKVGCKNVNTFIRIFKQIEGTTPGKFQQNN